MSLCLDIRHIVPKGSSVRADGLSSGVTRKRVDIARIQCGARSSLRGKTGTKNSAEMEMLALKWSSANRGMTACDRTGSLSFAGIEDQCSNINPGKTTFNYSTS